MSKEPKEIFSGLSNKQLEAAANHLMGAAGWHYEHCKRGKACRWCTALKSAIDFSKRVNITIRIEGGAR